MSFQGIRADETHRLEARAESTAESRRLPLAELGITKADVRWWMELEKASGRTFKNGWSYEQLLEKVQAGVLDFAEGALLCQADQGECTGDA